MSRKNNDLTCKRVEFQEKLVIKCLYNDNIDNIDPNFTLDKKQLTEYRDFAKSCKPIIQTLVSDISLYNIEHCNDKNSIIKSLFSKANSLYSFRKSPWNPADIWLLKRDYIDEIKNLIDAKHNDIYEFNKDVTELIKNKIIIPISLKLKNNPKLSYINTESRDQTNINNVSIGFWCDNETKNIKGLKINITFNDDNAYISVYPKASSKDCAISFCVTDKIYTVAPMTARKKDITNIFGIENETPIAKSFKQFIPREDDKQLLNKTNLLNNFFNAVSKSKFDISVTPDKNDIENQFEQSSPEDRAKLARIIYVSTGVIEKLDLNIIRDIYNLGLKFTPEYCSRYQIG